MPSDEPERRAELRRYAPEGTRDPVLEEIGRAAGALCGADWAGVSFVREEELSFGALTGLDLDAMQREHAPCAHSVCDPDEVTVVEDAAADPRTEDNPYVTGEPGVRFYAGAPLETPTGHALGTVFAMKAEPDAISQTQRDGLKALSRLAMKHLAHEPGPRGPAPSVESQGPLEPDPSGPRQLDAFAAAISHELRNVLSGVVSNLSLLEEELAPDGDEARRLLEDAQRGSQRMHELTGDLLRFARAGRSELDREPVNLDLLLDDLVQDLEPDLAASGGTVEAGPLPTVLADPGLLRLLFDNLLRNAIRYSGQAAPRVRIAHEPIGDGWVRLDVADEGVGIPEDEQDEIFELFQRGSNASEHTGTGVGLALVARIVEAHGGEAGLESTPGEGTTVWFTLEMAAAHADA